MQGYTITRCIISRPPATKLNVGRVQWIRQIQSLSLPPHGPATGFSRKSLPRNHICAYMRNQPKSSAFPVLKFSRQYTTPSSINSTISGLHFSKADPFLCEHKELTKAEIAEQFDLQYRDLRDIDLKSEAGTRILVRPSTILVQFFDLCVIIQADEAMLIDRVQHDQNENSDEASTSLTDNFKETLIRIRDAPSDPSTENISSQLPYEFHVLEAAFIATLSHLRTDLHSAREAAETSARQLKLEPGVAAVGLDQLFERSQRLFKIEQKARLLRETARELLDTDEDLAAMYISDTLAGKPHAVSNHQEVEYMLEAYHKAADNLAESASSVISAMRKKENNFRSALAVQRNEIMFFEARVAVYTLGMAAGTLIAGLFGMNLINYAEEAPWGFPAVTAACVVSSVVFTLVGARRLRKITTLQDIQRSLMPAAERLKGGGKG